MGEEVYMVARQCNAQWACHVGEFLSVPGEQQDDT